MILVETDELTADDILLENYDGRKAQAYNFSHMTLRDLERHHIEEMLVHCGMESAGGGQKAQYRL